MSVDIKIKEEILDPEYEEVEAIIKNEPQDIPESFFDEFEDNRFLEGLVDSVNVNDASLDNDQTNPEPTAEEAGDDSTHVQDLESKIRKLSKTIEHRQQKLAGMLKRKSRSRSPNRWSSKRKRSSSRERSRRSRSADKWNTNKSRHHSHGRDHRSSSRGRRSRSGDRRSGRSNSGERHSSRSKSKKVPFIDELEQILAAKGQSFPEKECLKKLLKHKEVLLEEIKAEEENTTPYFTPVLNEPYSSSRCGAYSEMNFRSNIQYHEESSNFPMPVNIKTEPMDYDVKQETRHHFNNFSESMLQKIKGKLILVELNFKDVSKFILQWKRRKKRLKIGEVEVRMNYFFYGTSSRRVTLII